MIVTDGDTIGAGFVAAGGTGDVAIGAGVGAWLAGVAMIVLGGDGNGATALGTASSPMAAGGSAVAIGSMIGTCGSCAPGFADATAEAATWVTTGCAGCAGCADLSLLIDFHTTSWPCVNAVKHSAKARLLVKVRFMSEPFLGKSTHVPVRLLG
jgi:hypothetical protein